MAKKKKRKPTGQPIAPANAIQPKQVPAAEVEPASTSSQSHTATRIEPEVSIEFAGLKPRIVAYLIDSVVSVIPMICGYFWLMSASNQDRVLLFAGIYFLLLFMYWIVPLVVSGGTWGKRLMGIEVVDRRGQYVTLFQGMSRSVSVFVFALLMLVCFYELKTYTLTGVSVFHVVTSHQSASGFYLQLGMIIVVVQSLVLGLMGGYRALHDVWAGSFVVTRSSRVPILAGAGQERDLLLESRETKHRPGKGTKWACLALLFIQAILVFQLVSQYF